MAKRVIGRMMPSLVNNTVEGVFPKISITSDEFVIGRSMKSSFCIPDVTLSRRHCVFSYCDEKWSVTDESTGGTYINGVKMANSSTVTLKAGDSVQFGSNSKWKYSFNYQHSEAPDVKRVKLDTDETIPSSDPKNEGTLEKVYLLPELDERLNGLQEKPNNLIGNELENEGQKDNGIKLQHEKYKFDQRTVNEHDDLKLRLAQAQKLTEKLNSERAKIQAALLERDQQLQNLQKTSSKELLILRRKLKAMKERLDEKEKQEGENMRCLQEVTSRTLILEEEGKKQQEYNQALMEHLLCDIDEREEATKRRIKESLENLYHDKTAIENQIKEKSEAKEDTGKLNEELERVKQNLVFLDQKRVILEKELSEAVESATVNTLQAREEILHNFGELMETELQCSICNELFVAATTLTCNHTFCKHCITEWKKKKKECPVCRKAISAEFRSLSLDNFINKMVENLSDDMKKRRQELKNERQALDEKNKNRSGSGERRRVRSVRRTATENTPRRRRARRSPPVHRSPSPPVEVVTVDLLDVSDDEDYDEDNDSSSETSDSSDFSFADGVAGSFYGGYGNCFNCGRNGHWANGCPDLF